MKPANLVRLSYLLVVAVSLLAVAQPANAQWEAPVALDVILLVRDATGTPMKGVTLDILAAGPPNEPYDSCLTGETGKCFTAFFPDNLYIIQFRVTDGWRGRYFVALDEQGSPGESCPGPGFCVYFSPDPDHPEIDTISFVVLQRDDGLLVPVWDMSVDAAASPEPFFAPGQSTEGVDMSSGLSTDLIAGPSPIAPEDTATPIAQVAVGTYDTTIPPTSLAMSTPYPVTAAPVPLGLLGILLGVLVLMIMGIALLLAMLWLQRGRKRNM